MDELFKKILENYLVPLVNILGPKWSAILMIAIFAILYLYKEKQEARKESAYKDALIEKEKTIQRMANDLRGFRSIILKDKCGLTDEEIDRYFYKNDFKDGAESRKALEQKKDKK